MWRLLVHLRTLVLYAVVIGLSAVILQFYSDYTRTWVRIGDTVTTTI